MDTPIVGRFLLGNEKNVEFTGDHDQVDLSKGINEALSLASADDRLSMETSSGDKSSLAEKEHEDKLKSTKAEMAEVRKENEKLKVVLAQIMKEYKSLHTHFVNHAKQESTNNQENDQLVSLTLGRQANDQQPKKIEKDTSLGYESVHEKNFNHEGLQLRLDCGSISEPAQIIEPMLVNPSHGNSFEQHKEDEPVTDALPLVKSLKITRSVEDEISQQHQTQLKRARVSVRARCDTPTMNDGCRWRKYGQKTAKGNPCPRAYYRCTVSPMCPVRKQVQRCAQDTSILITTYEGNHNHPLSISATSMASTTSAAATMLQSSSSTTTPNDTMSAPTILNSHPTITLDLTSLPKYPSTSTSNACFNFSSSSSTTSSIGCLSYGTSLYDRSMSTSSLYQPYYMQTNTTQNGYLPMLVDHQKAAITADPRFRSVVEAAITSLINKNSDHNGGDGNKSSHDLKFGYK